MTWDKLTLVYSYGKFVIREDASGITITHDFASDCGSEGFAHTTVWLCKSKENKENPHQSATAIISSNAGAEVIYKSHLRCMRVRDIYEKLKARRSRKDGTYKEFDYSYDIYWEKGST